MKTRYFFLLATFLTMGFSNVLAQAIKEKTPNSLNGVWQMCFYRSASPNAQGELKTGNTLKILSDDGKFTNVVMMPQGAIIIGSGTYEETGGNVYVETVEKNLHLPQLVGQQNKMTYEMKGGDVMVVKYFLKEDINGNRIDSWVTETWKRVIMPSKYPENIIR